MTQNNILNNIIKGAKSFQYFLGVLMLFSLLVLVTIQVILRYFLNLPLMGIEELLLFPTIWLYMIGAANASEERSHIEVDIVETFLSNFHVKRILIIIKSILTLVVGVILCLWFFDFFQYSLTTWKLSALLSIPLFFAESALFVGIFLMTFYSFFDFLSDLKLFKKNAKYNMDVGDKK